jgi:aminomethyltransferase
VGKRTALYADHVAHGARMVDFGGWALPLHYGSQLEEHQQVRRAAGVFDVSHMTIVDIDGREARAYLGYLQAGKVPKGPRAHYACMLNEQGGIVDDVIVYAPAPGRFRLVANAATRQKDLAWMGHHARAFDVELTVRPDLAMLAVQGPHARAQLLAVLNVDERAAVEKLATFQVAELAEKLIARTGYTGEDGFEIMLPEANASGLWQRLITAGAAPAGLGARDTLRLEAGLNLYGADMDETVSPLECGLAWTVDWTTGRDFIGRAALVEQHARRPQRKRVGLIVQGRSIPRAPQKVIAEGVGEGEITSGTFSPTLGVPIALARVPTAIGQRCEVESRGRRIAARVIEPPFVRHGQACSGVL